MITSQNKYDAIESFIFTEGLRIASVMLSPEKDKLYIHLNNNSEFVVSVKNYKALKNASGKQLKNYRLVADGVGIHWPGLDEDLSLKGFLKEFLVKRVRNRRKLVIS